MAIAGLGLLAIACLTGCGSADWVPKATGNVEFSDGSRVTWGIVEFVPLMHGDFQSFAGFGSRSAVDRPIPCAGFPLKSLRFVLSAV